MRFRYALSQLSRAASRRAFGRMWLSICAVGALITLAVVGWRYVFFVATVWLLCIFAPVRIAVESLHSRGPMIRRDLQREVRRREDRYATPERIALMVEALFADEVHLPRLAPPDLGQKVRDAAAGISRRALDRGGGPSDVLVAATTCAAVLQEWTRAVAAGEATAAVPQELRGGNGAAPPTLWNPHASVQDQWGTLRAIAALAALTKTLAAVYEDSGGRSGPPLGPMRSLCEAAMDYADQIGLRLDGAPWDEPPAIAAGRVPPDRFDRLASAWSGFCAAPSPAPRRLRVFVEALTE